MALNPIQPDGSRLSCVIADDSESIRAVLGDELRLAGVDVAGIAKDGAELLSLLTQRAVDAIVLDLRLGSSNGIELARRVAELAPGTAVVLHTSFADVSTVATALAAGVRGVVLKRASAASLLHGLEEVAAGRTYLDPRLPRPAAPER